MVSTRNHPSAFPPPELASPTKASPSKTSPAKTSATTTAVATPARASTIDTAVVRRSASTRSRSGAVWSHTPSNLTLFWLCISLPLVIWDTGYVLGRPYTMPGGYLHSPLYVPYKLYGTIDYFYGWPAINEKDGFTSAQGALNVIETLSYGWYLYLVFKHGVQSSVQGRGAPEKSFVGKLGEARLLSGKIAGLAVLVGFTASVMTTSKTVLYMLNEAFSGFRHTGHNDWFTMVFLFIIPNYPWIVVPSYMSYVFGQEILEGLEIAATGSSTRKLQ